jgi:hypothetical protein
MRLLNVFGEAFVVPAAVWSCTMELARAHGCIPKWTRRAAIALDITAERWSSAHYAAFGEEVGREAARKLAEALFLAAETCHPSSPVIWHLAEYCTRSGFLICHEAAEHAAVNLLNPAGAMAPRTNEQSFPA